MKSFKRFRKFFVDFALRIWEKLVDLARWVKRHKKFFRVVYWVIKLSYGIIKCILWIIDFFN